MQLAGIRFDARESGVALQLDADASRKGLTEEFDEFFEHRIQMDRLLLERLSSSHGEHLPHHRTASRRGLTNGGQVVSDFGGNVLADLQE